MGRDSPPESDLTRLLLSVRPTPRGGGLAEFQGGWVSNPPPPPGPPLCWNTPGCEWHQTDRCPHCTNQPAKKGKSSHRQQSWQRTTNLLYTVMWKKHGPLYILTDHQKNTQRWGG